MFFYCGGEGGHCASLNRSGGRSEVIEVSEVRGREREEGGGRREGSSSRASGQARAKGKAHVTSGQVR